VTKTDFFVDLTTFQEGSAKGQTLVETKRRKEEEGLERLQKRRSIFLFFVRKNDGTLIKIFYSLFQLFLNENLKKRIKNTTMMFFFFFFS
jgi:hypothetical protein